MALEYKIDVLDALKTAGYSTDKLRMRKLLSESVIQHLRRKESISWTTLERICSMLNLQPGDILVYNGTPDTEYITMERNQAKNRREFEYLYWIWNTKFRKEGESAANFHQKDYESFLPVPAGWSFPSDF